jgi:hypothetical protein
LAARSCWQSKPPSRRKLRHLDAIVETLAVEAADEIKRVGNGAKERPVSALV